MLEVTPIKAFYDNYLWLFQRAGSHDCVIVDPGDAEPVLQFLSKNSLNLTAIFITHHHADHTGGIEKLLKEYDVPVYGPDSANIPAVSHPVKEGSQIQMFGEIFKVLEIPGHTLDHIAYYTSANKDEESPVLFCGDTLFAGGCGRVFEGTHPMMYKSLQKLAQLPPETRVFCAHEYTMANLAFARAVTPENETLKKRVQRDESKRELDQPTVPSSIKVELATNPFLRCEDPEIIAAAQRHSGHSSDRPDDVFAAIRSWKDSF